SIRRSSLAPGRNAKERAATAASNTTGQVALTSALRRLRSAQKPPPSVTALLGSQSAREASARCSWNAEARGRSQSTLPQGLDDSGGACPSSAALRSTPSLPPLRRLRHQGHTTSAATPTTPAAVPARPRFSAVVVEYSSSTSLLVGTTTMKLGVARQGPFRPGRG